MKTLILALLLTFIPNPQDLSSKIKTFRNHKKFMVKYDRFQDSTEITINSFYIKNQRRSNYLDTSITLTFKGQDPPERVRQVYFFFNGPGARVYDSAFVLIDGQRFEIAEVDQVSSGILTNRPSAMLTMEWSIFFNLANSKTAEMQIGTAELRFEDEHKQAFRDLISLLKQN